MQLLNYDSHATYFSVAQANILRSTFYSMNSIRSNFHMVPNTFEMNREDHNAEKQIIQLIGN